MWTVSTKRLGPWLTGVAVLLVGLPAFGAEITWRDDYDQARAQAMAQDRPLLLSFGSADCLWCRKMHATTFRDNGIVALVQQGFIPLKIEAEQYPTLVATLQIRSFPTLLFAAPDGTILHFVDGYVDVERMSKHINQVQMLLHAHRLRARQNALPPQQPPLQSPAIQPVSNPYYPATNQGAFNQAPWGWAPPSYWGMAPAPTSVAPPSAPLWNRYPAAPGACQKGC